MPFLLTYIDVSDSTVFPACWIVIGEVKFQAHWPYATKHLVQDDEYNYHDSRQALFIEGISNYSLSRKTVNRLEKISGMFIAARPIRCEMKQQKITAKPQHGLVTTWHETTSWLFLPRQVFNFTVFKYWNFPFSISAYVSAKNRYERYFTEKRCWIEETGSDTAIQCVWE